MGETMKNDLDRNIDELIQREIERINNDLLEWKIEDINTLPEVVWKPRTECALLIDENSKRLTFEDRQLYHDLQLSRGACVPKTPEGRWLFPDPKDGLKKFYTENHERLEHLKSHLQVKQETKIMEIGVRTGHYLYFLKKMGFNDVSGIDCVRLNVLLCIKNGLDVSEVDAHEMSIAFEENSFGIICAYHCLEHCYDPPKVLAECYKILEPGGGIHIEIPMGKLDPASGHCYAFEKKELGNMMKTIGFSIVNYQKKRGFERIAAIKDVEKTSSGISGKLWTKAFFRSWVS